MPVPGLAGYEGSGRREERGKTKLAKGRYKGNGGRSSDDEEELMQSVRLRSEPVSSLARLPPVTPPLASSQPIAHEQRDPRSADDSA